VEGSASLETVLFVRFFNASRFRMLCGRLIIWKFIEG